MQERGAGRQLPEADEVSGVLREILAGSEFATFQQNPLARLLDWVARTVRDLWRWLRESLGDQGAAAEIVTVVIVVAVAVLAVYLARRYAPEWLRRGDDEEGEAAPETPATAREWLRLATDRAGRGELRPAATALYQGFLLTLDRQGALSFHSSKTPGDYALEMGRGGGTMAAGSRFLDSFQDFSFGQQRPTAAGYDGLARLAREAGCPTGGTETERGAVGGEGAADAGEAFAEAGQAASRAAQPGKETGQEASGPAQGDEETGPR